jgi:hypothetical protein
VGGRSKCLLADEGELLGGLLLLERSHGEPHKKQRRERVDKDRFIHSGLTETMSLPTEAELMMFGVGQEGNSAWSSRAAWFCESSTGGITRTGDTAKLFHTYDDIW